MRGLFFIVVLALSFGVPAHAVEPTKACPVPAGLTGPDYLRLASQFRSLERMRRGLVARVSAHNGKCRGVRVDQPALVARCKATRRLIEEAWGQYEKDVKDYKEARLGTVQEALRLIEGKMSQVTERIKKTKHQLLAYSKNYEKFNADLEKWGNLASDAQKDALLSAKEAVVSMTLQYLSIKKQTEIELTEQQRRSVKKLLKSYGPILDYARKFSTERLADLKTDASIIKDLVDIKTASDLSTSVFLDPDDRKELLTAIGSILEVFVKDPRLGLILTDAGIVTAAALGWTKGAVSHARVNQLLANSESQLRAVASLSLLYRNDIDRSKALRRQIGALRIKVGSC